MAKATQATENELVFKKASLEKKIARENARMKNPPGEDAWLDALESRNRLLVALDDNVREFVDLMFTKHRFAEETRESLLLHQASLDRWIAEEVQAATKRRMEEATAELAKVEAPWRKMLAEEAAQIEVLQRYENDLAAGHLDKGMRQAVISQADSLRDRIVEINQTLAELEKHYQRVKRARVLAGQEMVAQTGEVDRLASKLMDVQQARRVEAARAGAGAGGRAP